MGLSSPAGDEGHPGTLETFCTYRLIDPGILSIHMTAETDSRTIVNFAHYSYFTLNYRQSIGDHLLQIDGRALHADGRRIDPIVSVTDTPFDFRRLRRIAEAGNTLRYQLRTPSCSSWTSSRGAPTAAEWRHRPGGLYDRTWTAVLRWRLSQGLASGARWLPPLPSRRTVLGARTISRRSQSSKFPLAGAATRRGLPADDGIPFRQRGLICPFGPGLT